MVEFGGFKANVFTNQRLPYGIQFFICQKITEFDRHLKKDGGSNSQSIVTINNSHDEDTRSSKPMY